MNERPYRPPGSDDDAAPHARRRLLPPFDDHVDEQPPPELDRRVLARAREALHLEKTPERHYRGPRWTVPFALAATVLLSFGLVLQLDPTRQGDATLYESQRDAATGQADARLLARREDAPADSGNLSTLDQSAAAEIVAPRGPKPASSAPSAAATVTAAAPAPPAAPQARQPAARAEEFVADLPSGSGEDGLATLADANMRSRAKPSAAPTAPPAAANQADASQGGANPHADPQRWLAEIERLRAAGDLEAARRELVAFRQRHPDRPLPSSLDALR